MDKIYLDYAAATPLDPAVLNCVYDLEKNYFGNPSSVHRFGQKSKNLIENARKTIAGSIGAYPDEIVFTSGGTESNNMALIGAALANRERGRHIITTRVEHPAVLETSRYLERSGFTITYIDVDGHGMISLDQLDRSVSEETIVISVMLANNETGVILPVEEIVNIIGGKNILLHSDAVQAFGKLNIDVSSFAIDMLSLSSHKIYGPKGIGALYIRRGKKVEKYIHGGAQEAGFRAGTENVAAIGGFAEAVEQLTIQRDEAGRIRELRNHLESELKKTISGLAVNGEEAKRLYTHSSLYFPMIPGNSLLMNLDINGIAVSMGSACSSGSIKPSHVLTAMGFTQQRVSNSIRVSLGRFTTKEEIDKTIQQIKKIVGQMNIRESDDSR